MEYAGLRTIFIFSMEFSIEKVTGMTGKVTGMTVTGDDEMKKMANKHDLCLYFPQTRKQFNKQT